MKHFKDLHVLFNVQIMKTIKRISLALLAGLLGLGLFVAPAFAARKDVGILNFFAKSGKVVIRDASVVSIDNATDFTISAGGKDYSVHTDANTKFRRKFWGKGAFSDLAKGDMVSIIGTWTDNNHTAINAAMVRDLSVQKRHGVFIGTIDSLSGMTFTLKSVRRGDIKVTLDSSTKLINHKGQAITLSDMANGQRVRVRGLWDKTAGTLTEVTQVKDFSLPAK